MKYAICALMCLGFAGCQSIPYEGKAHDITRKPQEAGVIGIPLNYRDEDRNKAEQRMQSNCNPNGYKILEEGEVAIGEQTKSSGRETNRASTQRQVGSLFGVPLVSGEAAGKDAETSQTTTSIKEWQIKYKCMAGAGGVNSGKSTLVD